MSYDGEAHVEGLLDTGATRSFISNELDCASRNLGVSKQLGMSPLQLARKRPAYSAMK